MKAYSKRDVRARKILQSLGVDPDRNPGVRTHIPTCVVYKCSFFTFFSFIEYFELENCLL